jgi:sugar phosphate isomerase/epimerase
MMPQTKGAAMPGRRPIFLSVVQFQGPFDAGNVSIAEMLAAAKRHGADGFEIRPEFWRDKERELPAAREQAARDGLMLTYATHNSFPLFDPAATPALRQDIADARALGSPLLRIFPGAVPADDDQAGWERGRAIADEAAAQGIGIALENYARTPGGTLAEVQRTLAGIPSLQTNVDIGNYTNHGEDVPGAVRALGDRVVSAHLKDSGAAALGEGSLPLPAILDALDALPQRVLYIFEFAGGDDPDGPIAKSMTYLATRR